MELISKEHGFEKEGKKEKEIMDLAQGPTTRTGDDTMLRCQAAMCLYIQHRPLSRLLQH